MRSQAVPPSHPVSPAAPWDVVYMDTLTLGASLDRSCSSVLICVDAFTKWAEVVPLGTMTTEVLQKPLYRCVADGAPRVLRCDNG